MTENAQASTSDVATFDKKRLLLFVALLVMAVAMLATFAMATFVYFHFAGTIEQLKKEKASLTEQAANATEVATEVKTADFYRQEERALAESQLAAAARLEKEASESIAELEAEISNWQTELATLLETDKGKRLSAVPQAVRNFYALGKLDRVTPEYAMGLRNGLKPLAANIHAALKDEHVQYKPTDDTFQRIRDIRDKAQHEALVYEEHNSGLASILASTPSEPQDSVPLLKDAIEQLEREWNAERIAAIEVATAKAREDGTQRLASAKAEATKVEYDIEVQEQLEANELKREEERQRQEELAEKLAREKLEREFDSEYPAVSGLLKPFTSHGFRQPGGSGFITTTKNGPISLSRLRGRGLLEPTVPSQKALHYLISANAMNDRELGGFPEYVGGAGDFEGKQVAITRAQGFLIKYGPLMVEKGILAE